MVNMLRVTSVCTLLNISHILLIICSVDYISFQAWINITFAALFKPDTQRKRSSHNLTKFQWSNVDRVQLSRRTFWNQGLGIFSIKWSYPHALPPCPASPLSNTITFAPRCPCTPSPRTWPFGHLSNSNCICNVFHSTFLWICFGKCFFYYIHFLFRQYI